MGRRVGGLLLPFRLFIALQLRFFIGSWKVQSVASEAMMPTLHPADLDCGLESRCGLRAPPLKRTDDMTDGADDQNPFARVPSADEVNALVSAAEGLGEGRHEVE